MSKKYKSYARLISKELGIEYDKVMDMTVKQVEEASMAAFQKVVEERINDKDFVRKIELLLDDYDKFYAVLGDAILRSLCTHDEDSIFEYSTSRQAGVDYDSEEGKRLLIKKEDDSEKYYSYYNRTKYLKMRSYYTISPILNDAVCARFPQFTHYSPSIYGYSQTGVDATITFSIKTKSVPITNEDMYEDEAVCDYEGEEWEDCELKQFSCTVESFLAMNWDAMLEDFLSDINFYGVKSKEEKLYKNTNDFLSSSEMTKFINLIKKTREEVYPYGEAASPVKES